MRKFQKRQMLEIMSSMCALHREMIQKLKKKNYQAVREDLNDCQEAAIQVGEAIEQIEGAGTEAVDCLEKYCETLYQISISLESILPEEAEKCLKEALNQAEHFLKEVPLKREAVFLPYKASMWDSMESVWKAADEDPDCDAYVIPIPYFEKNPDGSFKKEHYEGAQYPEYVPITKYDAFDFGAHHPDMIFIHNPYDKANYVTSIHPFFYSDNIKKYTDCLVYIPYYATTGGMSEAQSLCPAYIHADYIVIQSEKYKKFFDPIIPEEKFLPLGSPKFDSVIQKCQNPPKPPVEWQKKMQGKKVYFYNTSLNGMLANTDAFLKKMEYVFDCFRGREDACLIWRPHPLMESTFDSMRKAQRPIYDEIKQKYIREDWGIYDETPDIENTIALCDAYIGDAATSVTSLFGVAGKPLFILNNNIHHEPGEEDWRGEIIKGFFRDGNDEWLITQGNKLYYSPNNDYRYEYYCDLSEYASGGYYLRAMEVNHKVYVCPANAQDILIVQNKKIIKKIGLERRLERAGAFCGAWRIGKYIFLIPNQYPAIVRLDTQRDEVSYITEYNDIFIKEIEGKRRIGGSCVFRQYLMLASPADNQVLAIDSESMKVQILTTKAENLCGCTVMSAVDDELWLLPYEGKTITRWKPDTGEMQEYQEVPETLQCRNRPYWEKCMEMPFSAAIPCSKYILFSPGWGNMFLRLDKETGKFQEWIPPFEMSYEEKNGYYLLGIVGVFVRRIDVPDKWIYRYFDAQSRKLYEVNLEKDAYEEIPITFCKEELKEHADGFDRMSDWIMYCCNEDVFNTLPDFLSGHITGKPFDREKQIQACQLISESSDGKCGEKIYRHVCERR